MSGGPPGLTPARAALALALLAAAPAGARDLAEGLQLGTALRSTVLAARLPDDPLLYPEPEGARSTWRLRLELKASEGERLTALAAWELRLDVASPGASGAGILPPEGPAPYRLRQLQGSLSRSDGFLLWQELDRAALALHLPGLELTAGRQAIGWGRGVLFSAIDVFAPFTPLEIDREWRRGVDALRAELRLGDRSSLELVAAGAESWDGTAVAGRLRGYLGDVDAELAAGRLAGDLFVGASSSAAVAKAEVHGEAAVFQLREPLEPGSGRAVWKAVAGASYRFDVWRGVTLLGEYHRSGFGVSDPRTLLARLASPAFAARVARGDTQILGRHAVALLASSELSEELSVSLLALASPSDGSGVLSPGAVFTLGQSATVAANAYLPFGEGPRGGQLRSDYGATAIGGLVQLRIYD
ncbi:hypothetical protein [Anaeromyxobacter paludicola]|uniref:Uncharacterized protein n=1 Tax=Anaeromyxobacter paludicola TaxID=2918171 RepID=A0ABN6N1I2_9BACT|nr:hypothetical protein [Anaeromyxobacter paludicola]BDG07069.1 hypothetical protein AMPC_01820 [Anaeromyxobacter paludicola]